MTIVPGSQPGLAETGVRPKRQHPMPRPVMSSGEIFPHSARADEGDDGENTDDGYDGDDGNVLRGGDFRGDV